jgi:hypothetical protein
MQCTNEIMRAMHKDADAGPLARRSESESVVKVASSRWSRPNKHKQLIIPATQSISSQSASRLRRRSPRLCTPVELDREFCERVRVISTGA